MASAIPPRTPCWHCKHMRSIEPRAGISVCNLALKTGGMANQLRAGPGCSQWEREPGIDDDDWDPPGTARIAPYVPEASPAPRPRSRGRDGWWTEPPRPARPAAPPAAPDSFLIARMTRDPFRGYFLQDDD